MKTTLEMLSDAGFQAKLQSRCLAHIFVHLTGGNEAFYPLFYGSGPRRRARTRDSTGGRAGAPQPARLAAAAAAAHRRAAHVCEAYKSR